MKVMVIGTGGREHAIAKKCVDEEAEVIYTDAGKDAGFVPNADMESIGKFMHTDNVQEAARVAKREGIDIAIFGPEAPLVAGGVGAFEAEGVKAFGPVQENTWLEASKVDTKVFFKENKIPTADFKVFEDAAKAIDYVESEKRPLVIKADGLAAGKGVLVRPNTEGQVTAIRQIMEERAFGDAGERIVIEDLLVGEEASIIAVTDGKNIVCFPSSQDHKPVGDGDTGENTGGMGAYSPAPVVTETLMQSVTKDILVPTIHGFNRKGTPYKGILYAGIMVVDGKPLMLEYNIRMGDPETQPLLMKMKSSFVELAQRCIEGTLDKYKPKFDDRPAHGIVLASGGYPGKYEKGHEISGLEEAAAMPDVFVYHAGTRRDGDKILTSGGRVICVVGLGNDHEKANAAAYDAARKIKWDGVYMRNDIGHKAFGR